MDESLKSIRGLIRLIIGACVALGILASASFDQSVFDRALDELKLIKGLDIAEYSTKLREFRSDYATIRPLIPYSEGEDAVSKWFLFERIFANGYPASVPDVSRLRSSTVADNRLIELDDVFSTDVSLRGPRRFMPDFGELSHSPNILQGNNSFVDGVVEVNWPIDWYARDSGAVVIPVKLKVYRALRARLRTGESVQDLYWQNENSFRERGIPVPDSLTRSETYFVRGTIERNENLAFTTWSGASRLVEETASGFVLFPNLKLLWGRIATKTPDEAAAVIEDMKKEPTGQEVKLLGFSIAGRDALVAGPAFLIGLFFYLILNLAHVRRLVDKYTESLESISAFPLILFFSGRLESIGRFTIVWLLPTCVQIILLQRFWPVVKGLHYIPVVLCIMSLLLPVVILKQARSLRQLASEQHVASNGIRRADQPDTVDGT